MPNWCQNELHVFAEGKKDKETKAGVKQLQQFIKFAKTKDTEISLNKLCPLEDSEDWHSERCGKWGTNWDIDAVINFR
mgnify:CR=1 FL=1